MSDPYTLELENIQQLKTDIPSVVFVTLVMIVGIFGNVHAILVYGFYYGKGNHRNFILWLSTSDLLGCCITIPIAISHYVNAYTFPTDINCKFSMFFGTFFAGYSLALLDIIAADRYRRISSPLKKQLSHRGAQIACTVTCLVFVLLSVPNFVIYYADYIEIPNSNHTGNSCYIRMEHDLFDTVYTIIQSIIVVALFVSCIVLYALVLWTLTENEKMRASRSGRRKTSLQHFVGLFLSRMNSTSTTAEVTSTCAIEIHDVTEHSKQTEICSDEHLNNENHERSNHKALQEHESCLPGEPKKNGSLKTAYKSQLKRTQSEIDNEIKRSVRKSNKNKHLTKGRRVTIMFMIVSFAACVVYLPTIILKILIAFYYGETVFEALQGWYGVLGYFYLLNHAINPIVYGFLDARFRKKCKNMYLKLKCRYRHMNVSH